MKFSFAAAWNSFPTTSKVIVGLSAAACIASPFFPIPSRRIISISHPMRSYPIRQNKFFDARFELPASVGDHIDFITCDLGMCGGSTDRVIPAENPSLGVEDFWAENMRLVRGWRAMLFSNKELAPFFQELLLSPPIQLAGLSDWHDWPITKQVGEANVRLSERFTRGTRELEITFVNGDDEAYSFAAEWSSQGPSKDYGFTWTAGADPQSKRPHLFPPSVEADQTARFAAMCRSLRMVPRKDKSETSLSYYRLR